MEERMSKNIKPFTLKLTTLLVIFAFLLAACATPTQAPAPAATEPPAAATEAPAEVVTEAPAATEAPVATEAPPADPMAELIAAAQAEGMLTTIALPHDWCNYGEVIESFKAKYGIEVNELDPNAGSGDEIEAVKANMNNPGPQAPDVIDVGFAYGPQLIEEGITQPYKVTTWDTIPDEVKDPDGYWYGDYYGVLSLQTNTDVVENPPQDWTDLLKPEYEGQVALAGDPRASNQAIQSVYATSLVNGGSLDDAAPGLEFWADVVAEGNFVPVISTDGTFARGETPITLQWDYLALADRDAFGDNPATVIVVPPSVVWGGVYLQGISAYAPHPNAAKLWMEHLYSDEGQLLWLKGYCHPIRYSDLAARGVIPQELADALPPADLYAKAIFPTLEQLSAARELITTQWDTVVGVDVQEATP
jgi:putative spermidine/putrescine transport system substrate-binding protein